jgi:hypothetical protein
MIVGHVRVGTVGEPKNENTHPFRFRSWLFAHHGTIPDFDRVRPELLRTVPDYLLRNIRGQTDSELLFHLMLAVLHDAGKIDDPTIAPITLREATRAALATVNELVGPAAQQMECALAITNGRIMVVTRYGHPVWLQERKQLLDCAVCRERLLPYGRQPKRVDHDHLRSALLLADLPSPPSSALGFIEVPDRTLVAISHDLRVEQSPLVVAL